MFIDVLIFLYRKLSEKDKCDYIVSTDANHLQVRQLNDKNCFSYYLKYTFFSLRMLLLHSGFGIVMMPEKYYL